MTDDVVEGDDERRRHPRCQIAASATLETRGKFNPSNQALCSVLNVSRAGIGVETGQPPMVGQQVFLRVALGDEIHELATRATRVDAGDRANFYQVGLDWGDCTVEQLEFLDRVFAIAEQMQS
ncbi:MAG: PilZ domain-containing protein [Planctomycetes bacterium]|nr:PilZ domain-containing protein [Planctomycetota bacterium]